MRRWQQVRDRERWQHRKRRRKQRRDRRQRGDGVRWPGRRRAVPVTLQRRRLLYQSTNRRWRQRAPLYGRGPGAAPRRASAAPVTAARALVLPARPAAQSGRPVAAGPPTAEEAATPRSAPRAARAAPARLALRAAPRNGLLSGRRRRSVSGRARLFARRRRKRLHALRRRGPGLLRERRVQHRSRLRQPARQRRWDLSSTCGAAGRVCCGGNNCQGTGLVCAGQVDSGAGTCQACGRRESALLPRPERLHHRAHLRRLSGRRRLRAGLRGVGTDLLRQQQRRNLHRRARLRWSQSEPGRARHVRRLRGLRPALLLDGGRAR